MTSKRKLTDTFSLGDRLNKKRHIDESQDSNSSFITLDSEDSVSNSSFSSLSSIENRTSTPNHKRGRGGNFKLTSGIWKFYTQVIINNEKRAQCNACPSNYLAGSTGNLWNHLSAKHPDLIPVEQDSLSQSTLDDTLKLVKVNKSNKKVYSLYVLSYAI
jgi:hypothetical protein